jgi:FkbM family methyltransferase
MHGTYIGDGRMLIATTWGARIVASSRDLSLMPDLVAHGVYDVPFTRFLQRELRPGDVVLDVGANIGVFTLLAAQLVGPQGRVVSYEPDPDNLVLLRDNISMNYVARWVDVVPQAVAADAGAVTLHRTLRFQGNSSLVEHDAGYRAAFAVDEHDTVTVEAVTLDAAAGDFARIDLVKIDVEGAEHLVLAGMQRLLESGVIRRVSVEIVRQRMGDGWTMLAEALQRYARDGWTYWTIGADGELEALSLDRLLEIGWFSQVVMQRGSDDRA